MSSSSGYQCLICGNKNLLLKNKYELGELLNLWKPISFKDETIVNLEKQSNFTALYFCQTCELEMFFPQIIGNDKFYEDLSTNSTAKYYENEKWDFYEALNEVEKGSSIIELGCGPGKFLELAKKKGGNVVGIEFNQAAITEAQKKGLEILDDKFDKTSLMGKFNAAFSFHVLEHVKDPLNFIEEMLHLVIENGLICISVPNQDGPLKYIEPCIMNMPPHHSTRWKLSTFIQIAKHFNLKIISYKYEPLLLKNRSYYTRFWLQTKINKQKSIFHKALYYFFSISFELLFGFLVLIGFKYFSPLKGQAIYIVMQKQQSH